MGGPSWVECAREFVHQWSFPDGAPIASVPFLLAVSTLDGCLVGVGARAELLVDFFAVLAAAVPRVLASGKVMSRCEGLHSIGMLVAVEDCCLNLDGSVVGLRHVGVCV